MKKIISVVLLMMIAFSSFVVANASEADVSGGGMFRAWYCDCGGTVTLRSTTTKDWVNVGLSSCPHGNIDHRPYTQKREIIKTYKCNNCSIGEYIKTTETRNICN